MDFTAQPLDLASIAASLDGATSDESCEYTPHSVEAPRDFSKNPLVSAVTGKPAPSPSPRVSRRQPGTTIGALGSRQRLDAEALLAEEVTKNAPSPATREPRESSLASRLQQSRSSTSPTPAENKSTQKRPTNGGNDSRSQVTSRTPRPISEKSLSGAAWAVHGHKTWFESLPRYDTDKCTVAIDSDSIRLSRFT